jgi:hypothetical protein
MSHGIEEHNARQRRAAYEFLERRTTADKRLQLKKLFPRHRYRANEWTRKDRFFDAYMGKDYLSTSTGQRYASEVTSMAVEQVRENAANLVELDEESFWLALGQLAGDRVQ